MARHAEPVLDVKDAPKLFVIGGAPRAGKRRLAGRIWATESIPSLSFDAVVVTFMKLAPHVGIDWGETPKRVRQLAIAARTFAQAGIEQHGRYVMEGESLTPTVVSALAEYTSLRACFLVLL